eukprot:NODE_30982_length_406_cov_2.419355.p3 GENE.NODE_30982_length_406_cov_2.419355~~NODE_30982_length_406_cov_2.419355.p3  ORF type:complete len:130 (+),score=39.36 NODE_30982_length_406_cov_2.419355:2-391(+)
MGDARERATASRRQKDLRDEMLAEEKQARNELQMKVRMLEETSERLRRQLHTQDRNPQVVGAAGHIEFVRRLAKLELAGLRDCHSPPRRAALRKRLLLKCHPDQQPCQDQASLATQVMQEMQTQHDWDD